MNSDRGWRRVLFPVCAWTLAAGGVLAGCSGSAVIDGGPGAGGSASQGSCPERVGEVVCRALPPDCPVGQFPGSDGTCWTGDCLDCIDGCEANGDCVVVEACGCQYHEGCAWAETRYRAALLPACVRAGSETCTGSCAPEICATFDCPWCNADAAECDQGRCRSIVNHECY